MNKLYFVVRGIEVYASDVFHNSFHLNYLEHARNACLRDGGVDFSELYNELNIKYVQVNSNHKYHHPLK